MKIVILDGYTLNPGDLAWDPIHALGECEIHDRTPPNEIADRAADAEIILTNKAPVDAATIARLPKLRYIGVLATGYNVVDVSAAGARGIVVTNVPAYGTRSVAQHVFALILELTNAVGHHARTVREGRWSSSIEWTYWDQPLTELENLTLGIVGHGRIGGAVAALGRAFGMRTIFAAMTRPPDADHLSLDEVLRRSDIVSLHCPLTAETQGMINKDRLALMNASALLVNTARGPLIVEADLADALNAGRIAGAALDVLSTEPPRTDNPLLGAKNCFITPHIAWAARASRKRLLDIVVKNITAFQNGAPTNVVS